MRDKPAYGEPCNQCGQCCMKYPCPVGQFLFKQAVGRCPALEANGDGFVCGLVSDPPKYVPEHALPAVRSELAEAARVLIDAGGGCDAQFVGEPINNAYRASKLKEGKMQGPDPEFVEALLVWGLKLTRAA